MTPVLVTTLGALVAMWDFGGVSQFCLIYLGQGQDGRHRKRRVEFRFSCLLYLIYLCFYSMNSNLPVRETRENGGSPVLTKAI